MKKIKLGTSKHFSATKGKPSITTVFLFVLLTIYTLVLFIPIIWSIYASLADSDAFGSVFNPQYPNLAETLSLSFDNFKFAWEELVVTTPPPNPVTVNSIGLLFNSLLYSILSALAFTICPVIVAYVTATFRYRSSKIIYAFVVVTMALPIVGSMASEIKMLHNLGLFDTMISMVILRFNFLSIYFLILHAQFSSIPRDYAEAAKVDGASNLRTMVQVVLPQSLNTIVTVFILSFITYWNDYQIPKLYFPSYPTAAYGIYLFVYGGSADMATIPHIMAVVILLTLPILIVFIIFNKRLRVSVAMGGIKS